MVTNNNQAYQVLSIATYKMYHAIELHAQITYIHYRQCFNYILKFWNIELQNKNTTQMHLNQWCKNKNVLSY